MLSWRWWWRWRWRRNEIAMNKCPTLIQRDVMSHGSCATVNKGDGVI